MLSRSISRTSKRLVSCGLSKQVRIDVPQIRYFSKAEESAYRFMKESVPLAETIDWEGTVGGNPLKEAEKKKDELQDLPDAQQCPVTLTGSIGAEAMGLYTYASRFGEEYILAIENDIQTIKEELYGADVSPDEIRKILRKEAKKDSSIQTHYIDMQTVEGYMVSGAPVDVSKEKKTTESVSMSDDGFSKGTLLNIFVNSHSTAVSQITIFKELFEAVEIGKKKSKSNKVQLTPSVYICLESLCEEGNIGKLPALIACAEQIFKAHKKVCTATIMSAQPLEKNQVDDLTKVMETYLSAGEQLNVETQVDKNLVAGFTMQIHEKTLFWDLSAQTKLLELDQSIDTWAKSASWQM